MSTFEAAYKSLLQGVSQQIPEERLSGQLTAQVNMISDPVTNLRRRPGVVYRKSWAWPSADDAHVTGWFTDIAGIRVHVLLNTVTGNIRIINENFVEEASLDAGAYLINTDVSRIRAASVGNEFFLANCDQVPVVQYTGLGADPANSGFFYILSGAFSKEYNITLVYPGGTRSASYVTPSGAGAGDAALSTPEYIATQLVSQLTAGATLNVSDVRITGWNFIDTDVGNFQKNTGTIDAPVWTAVAVNDEFTITDISNGKLRVQYRVTEGSGAFNVSYKVKVNGVWSTDTYTSTDMFLGYTGNVNRTLSVLATLFMTGLPTVGDATLLVQRDGPYVFASRSGGLSVSTTTGKGYLISSQGGFVTQSGDLPARLPSSADGFICRIGSGNSPQYFRYDKDKVEWIETAKYGSPSAVTNTPISVLWNGTAWELNTTTFEGRNAGDDESNLVHEFMKTGITGMATYQGRLVLMAGPLVSLSASGKPRRFFRSTVTSLLGNDPIEIGSSMNSSAAYEWALPFQKDLLLFSRMYQAVIPSGNTAITPANATVVPTSSHEVDTLGSPIAIGRTAMYCTPKSEDFFGVLEMIPSQYTDSQYVSQDATPHLPKYMGGRCRFAVSSSVASLALFAPSGDTHSLIVHEYHWDGDQKVQQAWHQWVFAYPVAVAYFASDSVTTVFVQNGQAVMGTIDPRAGAFNVDNEIRPFLDLNVSATIVDHVITIPAWMLAFDPTIADSLRAEAITGPLAGDLVGTTKNLAGTQLITVLSHPSGTVGLGIPYMSTVIPSPPVVKDYQQQTIHSGKATLLRYMIGTKNSSEFEVAVSDAYAGGDELSEPTLTFSSPELELGRGLYANQAVNIVPCRTDLRTTAMEVRTDGTGELNITSLEYVGKYQPKIKRR